MMPEGAIIEKVGYISFQDRRLSPTIESQPVLRFQHPTVLAESGSAEGPVADLSFIHPRIKTQLALRPSTPRGSWTHPHTHQNGSRAWEPWGSRRVPAPDGRGSSPDDARAMRKFGSEAGSHHQMTHNLRVAPLRAAASVYRHAAAALKASAARTRGTPSIRASFPISARIWPNQLGLAGFLSRDGRQSTAEAENGLRCLGLGAAP